MCFCYPTSSLESKLDHDEEMSVAEEEDAADGHDEHQGAVDLVDDCHDGVELVEEGGVTRAVPVHLDQVEVITN